MPNAVTWGYATLCWTHHVSKSGIPQRTLLQALLSFDLFACHLDTLCPRGMGSECRDTIKRVAFSSRPGTVISKISKKLYVLTTPLSISNALDISSSRRPKKDIINKTCPNSSDIEVAWELLLNKGSKYDFVVSGYSGIEKVVIWLQVKSCILCRKNLTLKAR